MSESLLIGMNDRLFASNWRPILQDIEFAQRHDLRAIQFHGQPDGLDAEHLGASLEMTSAALRDAGVTPVMELLIFIDGSGRTEAGATPLDILRSNLRAITTLGCTHVHWHLAIRRHPEQAAIDALEAALVPQCAEALHIATQHGFRFGVEHNAPAARPFHTPDRVERLLDALPEIGLVWDLNHTSVEQIDAYLALVPRMQMLHLADTPLPDVNHHLPLGLGTIDFPRYCRALLEGNFVGPAILEIGGLPMSGGYGRDTDEALISSRQYLLQALETAHSTINKE